MQQKHKTHQKPRWGKSQHLRGPKRKLASPESCLEGVAWITSNDREAKVIEKLNIETIEGPTRTFTDETGQSSFMMEIKHNLWLR